MKNILIVIIMLAFTPLFGQVKYATFDGRDIKVFKNGDNRISFEIPFISVKKKNIYIEVSSGNELDCFLLQLQYLIDKIYETAHNDKSVEGLSFSDKKGDLIGVDRDNFEELQYDEFYKEVGEPKENIITKENASLKIVKLSFEKDRRWTFIYEGNKISITVSDPALMDHINNGTSFSKGDSLIVDLEIIQKYDYEYNTFVNKDYKITAFKEHIHAPSQTSLDFPAHE